MPEEDGRDDTHEHHGVGETLDVSAQTILKLAHQAIDKFPDLKKRWVKFIGPTAVVSTALVVLASIAVARRHHRGESEDQILREINPEEIVNAGKVSPSKPKTDDKGKGNLH